MMMYCFVVFVHSGLCAADVCIPAVDGVWVWAHGGVDGSGRREHRRPWTNGRSTVQPCAQLHQLQVNIKNCLTPVLYNDTHETSQMFSCHLLAVKAFSCLPSGVTWTWLKFWCFVTSSGSCCQWSSSPGPPGSLCLDWVTCLPASFFCYLGPSYWSNHPGPASPCGTVSSSIMWLLSYLKICCQ